jgi:hypothetical protein
MALSEKEKQRIIEEEELRFETRKRLKSESGCSCGGHHGCCHGHRRGWFWTILIVVALAFAVKCMIFCHGGMCRMDRGPWGPGCRMGGPQAPVEPGSEAPAPMQKPVPTKK